MSPDQFHGKNVEYKRKLVMFVASSNQALAVIENREFRDLLPKEFDFPCRKTFTEVCLYTCFEYTKVKLLFDNYTPYGNMYVQYFNDDFTLCAVSVAAKSITECSCV